MGAPYSRSQITMQRQATRHVVTQALLAMSIGLAFATGCVSSASEPEPYDSKNASLDPDLCLGLITESSPLAVTLTSSVPSPNNVKAAVRVLEAIESGKTVPAATFEYLDKVDSHLFVDNEAKELIHFDHPFKNGVSRMNIARWYSSGEHLINITNLNTVIALTSNGSQITSIRVSSSGANFSTLPQIHTSSDNTLPLGSRHLSRALYPKLLAYAGANLTTPVKTICDNSLGTNTR